MELEKLKLITELRGIVDAFAAKYAALNVQQGSSTDELCACYEKLGKTVNKNSIKEFMELDRLVHLEIVELSGVTGLREVWQLISGYMAEYNYETLVHCWPDLNVLLESHADIVDAICEGNVERAQMLARFHLDSGWYRLDEQKECGELNDCLEKVSSYLAFHFNEQVTLRFLARYIAKVSTSHLSRLFKAKHGIDFTGYLKELRLQKAASLLREETFSVSKIAAMVGYKDASRFNEYFRDKFGVTPSIYRRQFRNKRNV
jgi:AraC-like DNA-binding protein